MSGIAKTIRAAMALRGVDRRALAAALGVTPQAVSAQLSRDSFSAGDLVRVAAALGYRVALMDSAGAAVFAFSPEDLPPRRRYKC